MTKPAHCEEFSDLPASALLGMLRTAASMNLAVSESFWDSDDHWEASEESFSAYYAEKVREMSALLGEPAFAGTWDDQGYPFEDPSEAHHATVWNTMGNTVCLALHQEDQELPFVVFARRL